jgi:hypothetical protein
LQVDEYGLLWLPVTVAGRALRGLIDTGAVQSHIERALAEDLGLKRLAKTVRYEHQAQERAIFETEAVLSGATIIMRLIELEPGRVDRPCLLIGQDLLQQTVLIYDGRARTACLYLW